MSRGDFLDDIFPSDPQLAKLDQFTSVTENVIAETIANRLRMRALLELLEEKGVLGPGEFDERSQQVADRDYEGLAEEIWEQEGIAEDAEEG